MSILCVTDLNHGFGDRTLLKDVSFRLLKGEHVGLIGANGEGKSTFLNIITGKMMPDEGKVEWAKDVRVGYLDQHSVLTAGMTIRDALKSAFNFIHAVTPIMMRQKSGSIINMSSVVGLHGNAGQSNYSASKAGLVALSKSIAKELGSRGVRSNCIAPGFIVTEMTDSLNDDTKQQIVKSIPLRREGLPEDVAKTALFLASDMSSYVTGQVISCCGGMNI